MNTIHLVSHTHWDREWYLTFQQFRLKLVHLIDHLIDILKVDPDFKFFLLDGQTIILEDYLHIRPERETDLSQFIKDGRIMIGPWYVSPDEFLVSPESHIRNLLEGNRLCHKFGGRLNVGYLPDSFGHIGQMPQILQGFGIETACVWRGLDDQPAELTWSAPDGSSVLLAYMRNSYSNAASLTISNLDKFVSEIQEKSLALLPFCVTGQILLMHGADHLEPMADLPKAIRAYQGGSHHDELMHSSLPQYFGAVRSYLASSGVQLPVITGELRSSKHSHLLQSVLSTRIWIKQRNHSCENDLLMWVEPLTAWAALIDAGDSPVNTQNNDQYLVDRKSIIRDAWKLLMHCHPHDSICGTSIDQVVNEMRVRFDQVDQINHELIDQSLQRISDRIDTSAAHIRQISSDIGNIHSSFIVFNPIDVFQTGMINLKIKLENNYSSFEIFDDLGHEIPYHQRGMGNVELISMKLDKNGLKQGLGMVHEGNIDGLLIREFIIEPKGNQALIRVTLSDHGQVDLNKWKQGIAQLEQIFNETSINEFIIHAYSDPEVEISMVAHDVPGHGYRSYWIRACGAKISEKSEPIKLNPLVRGLLPVLNSLMRIPLISTLIRLKKPRNRRQSYRIENDYFTVAVHRSKGTISVTDKRTCQVYSGLNKFIDSSDCGDLYNYCPVEHDLNVFAKLKKVEQEETNTYQKLSIYSEMSIPVSISADRKSRNHKRVLNQIITTVTLVQGVSRIDIHIQIDNQATDHRLRVHFPSPFACTTSYHDGHFEIIQRPIGLPEFNESWEEPPRPEAPQRQFTSIANGKMSLTIANRGLPEVEVINNKDGNTEIALTLLRCVGWLSRDDITTRKGHAGPMGVATPEAQMIGKFSFDYSIIPGDEYWHKSIHQAYAFNSPLKAINTTVHSGTTPSNCSFIENNNPDFIITTIKLSENDNSLVVRGYNSLSSAIELSLKPWRPFRRAQLVNLDESFINELPISQPGNVNLVVKGQKIVTIRFND